MRTLILKKGVTEADSIQSGMWALESEIKRIEKKHLEFLKSYGIGPDSSDLDIWEMYTELVLAYRILERQLPGGGFYDAGEYWSEEDY